MGHLENPASQPGRTLPPSPTTVHGAHSPAGTSAGQLSLSQCPFFCPRSATRCNSDTAHRDIAPLPSDDWSGRVVPEPLGCRATLPQAPGTLQVQGVQEVPPLPNTRHKHGWGRGPGPTHTHLAPSRGPSSCRQPSEPCPFPFCTSPPCWCVPVPGKVSGSQTVQSLSFRKCNDFKHFQSNLKTPKVMLYLRRASPSGLTHEVKSTSKNFTASF